MRKPSLDDYDAQEPVFEGEFEEEDESISEEDEFDYDAARDLD